MARLREAMQATPHLFAEAASYRHGVAHHLRNGWWRGPGPSTPTTENADKRAVEIECSRCAGANLFTLCVLAIEDAAAAFPEAFGAFDQERAEREQRAIVEQDARATAAVYALPDAQGRAGLGARPASLSRAWSRWIARWKRGSRRCPRPSARRGAVSGRTPTTHAGHETWQNV